MPGRRWLVRCPSHLVGPSNPARRQHTHKRSIRGHFPQLTVIVGQVDCVHRSATPPAIESRASSSCDSGLRISEPTFALQTSQPTGGSNQIMTERRFSINTQNATLIQAAIVPSAPYSLIDAPPVIESVAEEDFTIKCICDYADDDGNTIYCEKCDSWQHIECYYPGQIDDASRDDFDHSCADCKPRLVDNRAATERQRVQRQNKAASEGIDKKTKRPPSKSHKKKPKLSEVIVNGHRDEGHRNGSPQDHHPTIKKSKGHRSQASISSHQKRSPPFIPHNHGHPPSPARTPPDLPSGFQLHGYSDYFLSLYDNDRDSLCGTNTFQKLDVSNSMSLWLHDPKKLKADTNVENRDDIFNFLTVDIAQLQWPSLRVEEKESTIGDVLVRWKYLVTPSPLATPGRIGELNGDIGFQKDYCENPENHWVDCAHPRPFIFFLPCLPLFIDTRGEGSILRYARRSCHANTNLEIFIANKSEYHFWFVTERPLAENEQITIPWDFSFPSDVKARYLHALKMGNDDGAAFSGPDITEEEYERLSQTLLTVLSDHGGCACDLGADCSFARFHRNYRGRPHAQPNGTKAKKSRKIKQSHLSPTSTGHATNSRAASEGQDQYDEDDARSVSGSVRSKPRSRDLTPAHGVGDTNGIPLEQSDREKRKLAMVEDTFKKMEQQPQPARKKKRVSEGSTTNGQTTTQSTKPRQRSVAPRASISHAPNVNGTKARQQIDASKARRQSGSPYSGISPTGLGRSPQHVSPPPHSAHANSRQPSVTPKPTYATASTQTEEEENAWYKPCKPMSKRKIIPLATRLLKHRQSWLQKQALENTQVAVADEGVQTSPGMGMDLDVISYKQRLRTESPVETRDRHPSFTSSRSVDTSVDTPMIDTPVSAVIPIKPPPLLVSHLTSPASIANHLVSKDNDLRVQLPTASTFSIPAIPHSASDLGTPSTAGALSANSSTVSTTFPIAFPSSAVNGFTNPSPAKATKKLSLSDYKSMKRTNTTSAEKNASPPSLKPSLSIIDEIKSQGILDGSAIIDSPMAENTPNPLASVPSILP